MCLICNGSRISLICIFSWAGMQDLSGMVTNEVLSMHCLPQDVADNQIDSGDLMECLIQNKHQKDMNEKCAVGVTHFQLVSSALHVLLVSND